VVRRGERLIQLVSEVPAHDHDRSGSPLSPGGKSRASLSRRLESILFWLKTQTEDLFAIRPQDLEKIRALFPGFSALRALSFGMSQLALKAAPCKTATSMSHEFDHCISPPLRIPSQCNAARELSITYSIMVHEFHRFIDHCTRHTLNGWTSYLTVLNKVV
jgi:hypothetical protein